jgi:hypothetical protein
LIGFGVVAWHGRAWERLMHSLEFWISLTSRHVDRNECHYLTNA